LYVGTRFKGFKKNADKASESVFFTGAPIYELANLALILNMEAVQFFETLRKSAKKSRQTKEEKEDNLIYLNTGQRVKGMQYDNVIILEVSDEVWPFSQENIEQERRLFYVAITRTRENLFIINGDGERSQFLSEAGFI
jgi:superfamily I DNA/RNA helicase